MVGSVAQRYLFRGGTKPVGDALSWIVHTRLGSSPRSFLGKQLELGTLLTATVGELFLVSAYVMWMAARFTFYYKLSSEIEAVRTGRAFGELCPPMILMQYLLAQRFTLWGW